VIYVGGVVLGLVVLVAALFVYGRMQWAQNERRLREEIEAYVTAKGGTVTFDAMDGMRIEGPLGKGDERLTALRIMLASKSGDRKHTIGVALRKYLPDQEASGVSGEAETSK